MALERDTLDKLLKFGVDHGASDIHFEVSAPPYYRVRGELLKARYRELTPEATLDIARLILGDRHIGLEGPFPELDISYTIDGVSRFRVAIFRQRGSIGCVMRVVPFQVKSFEELNLPKRLDDLVQEARGLILVTGATGNGKSTTIAALIQAINTGRKKHIITIEDPIEFLFDNISSMVIQREVGTDTTSYQTGLNAALRQDPDIVMLGEIRDVEAATICLRSAETGHVVITTLHTPDTVASVNRFAGFFEDRVNALGRLADCLTAIVSLRLIRRADGKGMLPAVEFLRATTSIRECIRDPERHPQILEHMARGQELYGMQTFDQHLIQMIQDRKVRLAAAKAAASRPDELERTLMLDG